MSHVPADLGDLIPPGRASDHVALIDAADGRSVGWNEYRETVDGIARGLVRRGYERGQRIGILGLNSLNYVFAYMAIMKAGFVAVPVNHRVPRSTVEHIVQDAEVVLMLADRAFQSLVPAGVDILTLDDAREFSSLVDPGPFEAVKAAPGETAMILYTSGSTGRPKGVPLSHSGQLWVLERRAGAAKFHEHRLLVAAPLCHMNALLMLKLAAYGGGTIVLLPEFNAGAYIDAISRWHPTWLTSVPTMLALVAQRREQLASADLGSVKIVAMGSAPVGEALFSTLHSLFANAMVVTNYGTTEGGAGVFGAHPKGLPRPPLSIGYPLADIGFRLIGDDGDENENQGRLQMRTPAVMSGYLNLPAKTAEVLDADGWYDTGDIIRRDSEGFCYFVGRADDMFVCGGENVFPGEMEALLERLPAIQQACVVPVPDDIKGMKPVAFVVTRNQATQDAEAIKSYALENAPAYMHPRQVWFCESLPLGPTGKVDRKALASKATQMMAVPA
jgi:acyl-CoA synthetase (AMP-forming)/AMP-acid ligase II